MDVAAALSVVQTLFAALQCATLEEVCSFLGKKSELNAFSNTVSDIRVLLVDVKDRWGEISHDALLLLQELKDALYDADDLLDELITVLNQKRLVEDDRVSEEVCLCFSRFDLFFVADNLGKRIKNVREKLGTIVCENDGFKYDVDFSCVCETDVFGRDDNLTNIVGRLLDSEVHHDVSVLAIVGAEGTGKTALARLLYNDESVVKAFPLRLWICVSDLDQEEFNVNEIIRKIVRSATDQKHNGSEMDQVYDQLMELIEGRKYLLVIDGVWIENPEQFLKLVEVLRVGQSGSRIVVTTCSRETIPETIRDGAISELEGLSEENSWRLFEKTAFGDATPDKLVKIGQEIVKRCNNNPLAIRLVGSLLYGQDESIWQSFQKRGLADIRLANNDIKPILKLCYDHLKPELQSCFSFCAVFPKDFEIQKDLVIILWISQGFVQTLEESRSIEDAAEECFSVLLQRRFFHDVKKDEYGEIVSCKMHDLLHEFAREVHFSGKTRSRSFFQVGRMNQIPLNQLLETCTSLRTLVLRDSDIKTLPESIDKLLHLRCVDLSDNSCLEILPSSITNLYNLQTLRLRSCNHLKELPKDLSRLVNLKVLDIAYCYRLAYVPSDVHKLTRLHTLSDYKVCVASSSSAECLDQLQGLKALVNLKGHLWLKLWFPRNAANNVKKDGIGGAYLKNKEHLKHVRFDIQHSQGDGASDYEMGLLEDLQPHSNVQGVVLSGYSSTRFPTWIRDDNFSSFLPNLVRLEFVRCTNLQHLPWLGKLHNLKFLSIFDLPNLEYVETGLAGVQSVFPCIEDLRLSGLPKLKGFRNEVVEIDLPEDSSSSTKRRTKRMTRVKTRKPDQLTSLYLPQLKSLQIRDCLEMTSTLHCPKVEEMTLRVFNKKLPVKIASDLDIQKHPKLQSVITDNTTWLNSIPTEAFHCLSHICIYWDKELESLSEVEDIFRSCSFSLRNLEICHCPKLASLAGGLEHLNVLETLVLEYIANLDWINSKDEGNQWRSLHQSLRSLELLSLPKIVNLPKGMQYLTCLRSLRISDCDELKSMPKWVQELVSLKKLDIQGCPHLSERYENIMG